MAVMSTINNGISICKGIFFNRLLIQVGNTAAY